MLATVLAAGWLVTTSALAQEEPAAALSQIREQVLYANYRDALSQVETFLERSDLDPAERNAGLEVLATIHVALRQTSAAEEVLQRLYARDPGHRLTDPDASPPVLSAFGRARANPPPAIEVAVANETPELERRGPPQIRVRIGEGLAAVSELRLAYRQGASGFRTVVMTLDEDTGAARIPVLEERDAYSVSYYVEARAPSGHVIGRLGSAGEPITLAVPEAAGPVIVTRTTPGASEGEDLWWLWLVAGAVVLAGGAVATYFIIQEVSGPQDGSLGNIGLPLIRF